MPGSLFELRYQQGIAFLCHYVALHNKQRFEYRRHYPAQHRQVLTAATTAYLNAYKPANLPPIIDRLGIELNHWLALTSVSRKIPSPFVCAEISVEPLSPQVAGFISILKATDAGLC